VLFNSCSDILWCGYAGSSLEVKIETDSNDAVEVKTEADSKDVTECSRKDRTSTGTFSSSSIIFCKFYLHFLIV